MSDEKLPNSEKLKDLIVSHYIKQTNGGQQ
jgi:hypothetical protein